MIRLTNKMIMSGTTIIRSLNGSSTPPGGGDNGGGSGGTNPSVTFLSGSNTEERGDGPNPFMTGTFELPGTKSGYDFYYSFVGAGIDPSSPYYADGLTWTLNVSNTSNNNPYHVVWAYQGVPRSVFSDGPEPQEINNLANDYALATRVAKVVYFGVDFDVGTYNSYHGEDQEYDPIASGVIQLIATDTASGNTWTWYYDYSVDMSSL